MKALVYTDVETLSYQEFPDPKPQDDEVLIKVEYVGICGSDMHAFLGHDARRPAPLILGHEAAGQIVAGEHKGMRVTVNPLVTCGKCEACLRGDTNLCLDRQIISMPPREGAFAQYICMPIDNLVEVPENIPLEKAALCEPIACGWHAAKKCHAYLQSRFNNSKALVIGGGAIGVGAALSLQAMGLEDVILIEPNELRRNLIKNTTPIQTMAPDELSSHQLFDVIIDGVGFASTREKACAHAQSGGVIAHIGLGSGEGGLDVRKMTLQEIAFIGTYTYTKTDFVETAHAIFDGSLGELNWIKIAPLEKGLLQFNHIRNGEAHHPKILLQP